MNKNIAMIGAGNGGRAMAAHFTRCGASVNLCDLFPEYIQEIKKGGGIHLEEQDSSQFFPLKNITENIGEAVRDVKMVIVVTPAFTHKMIAEACADYLKDGQILVLNPGRTAGALEFYNCLRDNGCHKDIIVAETQTLIYSCRRVGGTKVRIYGVKDSVDISSIPGNRIDEVIEALHPYYPQFKPTKNALQTSLANIGAMFHPLPILMNVGRIETDERGFKYYIEGISPSVAATIEKLDEERLAVARAYDIHIPDVISWVKKSYDTVGNTLYENIQCNEAYMQIIAPRSLDVRYMTDDVPTGLVPISELGDAANVGTPLMDATITFANSIYGRDFRKEGRSLKNLGLENLTIEQIISRFETAK